MRLKETEICTFVFCMQPKGSRKTVEFIANFKPYPKCKTTVFVYKFFRIRFQNSIRRNIDNLLSRRKHEAAIKMNCSRAYENQISYSIMSDIVSLLQNIELTTKAKYMLITLKWYVSEKNWILKWDMYRLLQPDINCKHWKEKELCRSNRFLSGHKTYAAINSFSAAISRIRRRTSIDRVEISCEITVKELSCFALRGALLPWPIRKTHANSTSIKRLYAEKLSRTEI